MTLMGVSVSSSTRRIGKKRPEPMHKSHKGLLKRVKISASGKVRFHSPNSRHLKSNKTGAAVRSYRRARTLSSSDNAMLGKVLHRSLAR
ncbi:MAG: 50S ribosomal protein L35 [Planctomycetes bacterium]|nr:50S ribosomal protein L35 [Planctomycetota bacterium]